MLKNWKQLRILFATILLVFLVVSFLMLEVITQLPAEMIPIRKQFLIFLLIIILVVFLLFFLGFLSAKNNEIPRIPEQLPEKKDSTDKAAKGCDENETKHIKQGRLVKKLRQILDGIDTNSLERFGETTLASLAKEFEFVQGLIFCRIPDSDLFRNMGKYAWYSINEPVEIRLGESLTGQAAKDGKMIHLTDIPENYIQVVSGLGTSSPNHLYLIPLMKNDNAIGVIELASFREMDNFTLDVLQAMAENISGMLEELLFTTKQL